MSGLSDLQTDHVWVETVRLILSPVLVFVHQVYGANPAPKEKIKCKNNVI